MATNEKRRPSETADNGDHDPASGRFVKGNKAARGNPYARKAAALRAALFDAVTPEDMRIVVRRLVRQAKRGDVAAARELLTRLLGAPVAHDYEDRLAALESHLLPTGEDYP